MATTRSARSTRARNIPNGTATTSSATIVNAAPARRTGHPPLFIMGVGVAFLALWAVALITQVQTNEAFITNSGQVNIYKPDWFIFMQIPNLVMGQDTASQAIATLFGWGIELVYLGFIVGKEILQESVERSGQQMAGLFKVLSWVIVFFNGYTDYNYGSLSSAAWGHAGFAVVISFVVGFFGTIGMYLLEGAWKRA